MSETRRNAAVQGRDSSSCSAKMSKEAGPLSSLAPTSSSGPYPPSKEVGSLEPSIAPPSDDTGLDTWPAGSFNEAIRTMQLTARRRDDEGLFRLGDALTALFDHDPGYALEMLLDWLTNEVRP